MNKLEIVTALWDDDCGLPGSPPSTTLNQTGEYKQIISWVDRTYNEILVASRYYPFMREDFTMPLSNGTAEYAASVAGVSDLSEWVNVDDYRVYKTTTANEQFLIYVPWEEYRMTYLFQSSRTTLGRPQFFSVRPNKSLIFHPVPNDSFTVVGEYQRRPTAMTGDEDIPVFPEEYHMAIAYGALMKFGAFHAEPDKYVHGKNEHDKLMTAMRQTQLPKFGFGATLA